MKEVIVNKLEIVLVGVMSLIWKAMRIFNPRPIQERFAKRDPVDAIEINRIFRLPPDKAGQSLCLLGNNRIKSDLSKSKKGIAGRGELVKIKNPENGKFVIQFVAGAGKHPIPSNGISLDYDAARILGVHNTEEATLIVGPANIADVEFFHMYMDSDVSSRSARALGWYLFIGSLVYSGIDILVSVLTSDTLVSLVTSAIALIA